LPDLRWRICAKMFRCGRSACGKQPTTLDARRNIDACSVGVSLFRSGLYAVPVQPLLAL